MFLFLGCCSFHLEIHEHFLCVLVVPSSRFSSVGLFVSLIREETLLSRPLTGPSKVFLSSRWPVAQPRCGCTKGCVCAIADGEDTVVERETGRGVSGCVGCEREQVWRPVCTRGGRCAWWKQARTMIIPVRCFTCGKVRCKMRGRKETQNMKRRNEKEKDKRDPTRIRRNRRNTTTKHTKR